MKETGSISKSQYSGTLKNTVCTNCLKSLNHLDRVKQDLHEIECKKQSKLVL
ncbi:hypothetical protein [Nitrososphaeria virus YSH_1032793]|uniref:Uncharacterized protein n=1 Tax=Nitrososphaeria virus YSH_1032793 TaxID=3071320 RepID=A0A976UB94_9CAUD|nr:hypothetical protein QKV91_gp51 [Yangshan Harbor Nitrososphaeria virus]UVF62255.1 hypothetical protein [Nitrososphaeria virus YSH_1032793]